MVKLRERIEGAKFGRSRLFHYLPQWRTSLRRVSAPQFATGVALMGYKFSHTYCEQAEKLLHRILLIVGMQLTLLKESLGTNGELPGWKQRSY